MLERLSLRSVTTQAEMNFARVLNGIKQELPLEYSYLHVLCVLGPEMIRFCNSSAVKLLKFLQESACEHFG